MKLRYILLIWGLLVFLGVLFCIKTCEASEFIPNTPDKVERLVVAIYKAENSSKYPFGIKSVSCYGYEDCKKVCVNTVKNNVKRWELVKSNGDTRDYLTFLRDRYCPLNAKDDPTGLNHNWLKNVTYFLNKGE